MSYDPTTYPYDTVVLVTDVIGGIGFQGSGVLISPDEVLTASHVLYQAGSGSGTGTASNIVVTPAAGPNHAPFGTANGVTYHYNRIDDSNRLISQQQTQYDFAVIHLDHPFSSLGTMGLQSRFAGGYVNVTGYPGNASGYQETLPQYVTLQGGLSVLAGRSLGEGSSGGPVYQQRGNGPFVVGIVSSGNDQTGQGFFTQISASAFATIENWVKQDDTASAPPPPPPPSLPLVDPAYYDAANPDVAAAGVDPATHYDTYGWHEGRDPDAFFSTVGYLAANPDVRASGLDPAFHYDHTGWQEGRDPGANFNTRLYLVQNPDVAAAGIDPLAHYLRYGANEGRAIGPAIGSAGSVVGGFAREYYLLANPDVARSGYDPLQHYLATGWHEGRAPDPFFDVSYYLQHNPDVAAAGVDPLLHYDLFGWHEGRNPSAEFSTNGYLAHAPDVAAAHIDPLEHYLQSGIYEGRAIS